MNTWAKRTMAMMSFLIPLLLLTLTGTVSASDVAVIVHKDNPQQFLETTEVMEVFLGKKAFWKDGVAIEVFVQEDEEVTEEFCRFFLRKSPRQFHVYWKKAIFDGQGVPPRRLLNDAQILEHVAANPGAIGYVSLNACDDSVRLLPVK